MQAEHLPREVQDQVTEIAEESLQLAFGHIATRLGELGYPVTGDVAPDEAYTLEREFESYVRMMALNNPEIQRLQEASPPEPAEAARLLGFALFNHAKGKYQAAETLTRKAYRAVTGEEWDRRV